MHPTQPCDTDGVLSPDPSSTGDPSRSRRRIGLFGGTFDPPHLGHLVAAESVRDGLGLDEVRFVVANEPWQKTHDRAITPAERRVALVEAALDGVDGLAVSDVELAIGGPSYTVVTLAALSADEPDIDWVIVVGADAAAGLDTWHDAATLAEMAEVAVVNRPGDDGRPPAGWRWRSVAMPPIGISSTDIRDRVARGRSIRFLVPAGVERLVADWSLYRRPE